MASTSKPLSAASHVSVPAISAVHCVNASTNARSKSSSRAVTRSVSRLTAVRCGGRRDAVLLTAPSSHLARLARRRVRHLAGLAPVAGRPAPPLADQCRDVLGSPAELKLEQAILHTRRRRVLVFLTHDHPGFSNVRETAPSGA